MSGSARLQDSTGTAVPLAHVGYLPQDPTLPPGFTAAELVAYAVWLRGGTRSQATGAARRALSIVDLADHADERIGRLSGGMRQRVALAAVLAPRPRALVLDEPTGSLDPMQRDLFATTVARLAEDHVVVVSTHSLDRLALEADQLAILGDGRLVCASPPAGLCAPQPLSLEALTAASLAVLRGHVPDAAA
jgi:ABC-2 type transport system ATP-binding protein